MQLTTTKERVLEAVEKDPQAKETLKTLFPDVFEDDYDVIQDKYITMPGLIVRGSNTPIVWYDDNLKGLCLNNTDFHWVINDNYLKYFRTRKR